MAERETFEEATMTASNSTAATLGVPRRRFRLGLALLVAAATALIALWAGHLESASAKSQIFGYLSEPTETQAGSHPDIVTEFELGSRLTQPPVPCFCNDPKDVVLHAPAGVIANPHVVAECSVADLALFKCPSDSQAGVVVLRLFGYGIFPLYRTVPQKGQAGLFAFALPFGISVPQYIVFNARTGGDFGLDIKTVGISHLLPLLDYGPIFWGVPGDPANNLLRFAPGENEVFCEVKPFAALATKDAETIRHACPFGTSKDVPSSLPISPLTQNPTTCIGPLTSSIESLAYDRETDQAENLWPATTGCDALSFDPSLAAKPTTTQTDTASGVEIDLQVPQFQDPNTPSPSELRRSSVTLPEGFSINPNAADGKLTCSDAESRVGTEEEAQCPDFSKVGTVVLDSSALPAPIDGFIYLGDPKPGDPYRLVLTANGFGTAIKLLGTVHADRQTGQLVTEFNELPQAPFQRLILHFFGSERGLLATPTHCGSFPVNSSFSPWDSFISDQTATQFFTLDSGPEGRPCPNGARPFAPAFEAGADDNTGGAHTSFGVNVTRADGDQNLTGLVVKPPRGFAATLKGIPYCPQSALARIADPSYTGRTEIASPACPAASQVGTAKGGAGAGTHPVYVDGKVYLAGPYKGAPLSLAAVIPAVSGPYDLGNVVVRAAVFVDPVTAQVTAVSDPLPQILEGIPLRTRFIQVKLDRPNFALNPTNCEPGSIDATISGSEGGSTSASKPFQAADCADLPFKPSLKLKLKGGLKRRGHPAIHAVLTTKPGESNIRRVSVTLPKGELLDNSHIDTVCTRVDFSKDACPAGSLIGTAEATTPLLDNPLRGNVYLRSSSADLPDLVLDLKGQIDLEVSGRVDAVNGRLRATFENAPDAAVRSVVLDLVGGSKGLLINSESLCGSDKKATAKMTGQNGRITESKVKLEANCGSKSKAKRDQRQGHQTRKAVR